jgi:hypothetical protein
MLKQHIDTGTALWLIIAADKFDRRCQDAALGKRLRTCRQYGKE